MAPQKERELVLEALGKGKEIEKEGIKFYTAAAREVKDEIGRRNLEFLASEEKRHLELLSGILNRFKEEEKITALIEKYGGRRSGMFPERMESGRRVEAGEVDRRIIAQAKEVERGSIRFYEGYAGRVRTKGCLQVFKTLVEEERKHLQWLEFIEEEVGIHGYWLDLERTFGLEG